MVRTSIRGSEAQGVTFVELFFDLVFVFAVTQVTGVIAHDLTWGGALHALIVFWLVWWAWTQYTWSLNTADTERIGVRLYTLAATGIAFVLALTVPEIDTERGWLFCLAYLALRILGIGMQWRLTDGEPSLRNAVAKWTTLSSLGLVAVAIGAFLDPEARIVALAVAAVLDMVSATRAGSGIWELFVPHFAERHGLIVIVALGESLIAAGATASDAGLETHVTTVAMLAVIATCALWWTYFGWAKDVLEENFEKQPLATAGRYARNIYSFGHFPIIAGVVGFAVAIEEAVAHPVEHLEPAGALALMAGVTLFVGGTGVAMWISGVKPPLLRPAAIIGFVGIGAVTFGSVPAWAAMAIAAAVFTGLAALERRPTSSC
jgi:low temperature requirement protein LtrA